MTRIDDVLVEITPEVLLKAYACGIFPMAESADDPGLYWIEPELRGILPLEEFRLSRRMARTIRSDHFEMRVDHDFEAVIDGCARPAAGRRKTWINRRIRNLYGDLFDAGHCHTVEAYRNGTLVGGLYGVRLRGAFFGESMFHTVTDASKVALVHLAARLQAGGFVLLDTQFVTDHLRTFGAIELKKAEYHQRLQQALTVQGNFDVWPREGISGRAALSVLRPSRD
ncbi:leucyl/phenylalanyl-tRNA--protein transferase [Agaricicola taiwanensis]|uniref:Leucyl/phenylalanyl-tRNA--protein transferase n=1 Tax=Agaricicola taiwanensis TaxID=591372 RepID=A0A8J2YHQ2_9RHOB|nr:leucyl/phenylalanyl-tRNA--protein transferase [Agaricicola taiwanensis]GGE43723.1 leucyl/phenylalanyl-tRNA--protein transferase [Agaricicola taiwanensis]